MKIKRKKEMKMEMTLFHRRTDGGVKVWMARLNGDKVHQSWGMHEGKIQTTTHTVKGNDRQTAEERARHRFDRLIELRMRKGYVTKLGGVSDSVVLSDKEMDFRKLPRKFAPAKPIKKPNMGALLQWDKVGLLSVQRKWDGMRHRIVSDSRGRIRVYSSSNDDVTDVLWPLVENERLPVNTVLDVELVAVNDDGSDNFAYVSSIARSKPKKAHAAIAAARPQKIYVKLIAFDLLFRKGKPMYKYTYKFRREILESILAKSGIELSQETGSDLGKSMVAVRKLGWEGLVVWRLDQTTLVRTNGHPWRGNCWKVKFEKEEDVVAFGFDYGKGKNSNVVGAFNIGYYGGKPMGNCGGGLDDETRAAAVKWKYPCVIQIKYDSKSEKGFRFPVFVRKRDDKAVKECCDS